MVFLILFKGKISLKTQKRRKSMKQLTCNADCCAHYDSGFCRLNSITVDKETGEMNTKCASYMERSGSPYNMAQSGMATAATEIMSCGAYECMHNCTGKCEAKEISIKLCPCGKNAECGTYCRV